MFKTTLKLTAAVTAGAALLGVGAGSAGATLTTIYNNIPSPLPGNVPSEAFEAQSASEWGGQVEFAAGTWKNPVVTVTMSSWACQAGTWYADNCQTATGAKFEWPVTVRIYAVGAENTVGAVLAEKTRTFKMPYRPPASSKCTGEQAGKWYSKGQCFNGKAFKVTLNGLKIAPLPPRAIIAVAYNTSDYGAEPQRPQPCNSTFAGCPYDSLNVGTSGETPTPGADPLPEDAYLSSTWSGAYCDNGAGGTGSFRLDTGCWGGAQPAILVRAAEG